MKRNQIIAGVLITSLGIFSCNSNNKKETQELKSISTIETESMQPEQSEKFISTEDIDSVRAEIESLEIKPVEVSTLELKEKIKQKWSKLHFYVQNDIILKIKTYPYPEISKRTEEFYADENGLLLVVIEDNGDGTKGKPKDDIDKMYYFNNGELLEEVKKNKKSEYTIKESDAEELLSEYTEYLEIYKQQKE